jgi:hypothetical protein
MSAHTSNHQAYGEHGCRASSAAASTSAIAHSQTLEDDAVAVGTLGG